MQACLACVSRDDGAGGPRLRAGLARPVLALQRRAGADALVAREDVGVVVRPGLAAAAGAVERDVVLEGLGVPGEVCVSQETDDRTLSCFGLRK